MESFYTVKSGIGVRMFFSSQAKLIQIHNAKFRTKPESNRNEEQKLLFGTEPCKSPQNEGHLDMIL
jgi:hypothetical protein